MKLNAEVVIGGLFIVATAFGVLLPVWQHHENAAERTSKKVLKVFEDRWQDVPPQISTPKMGVLSPEPSLFDSRPMMAEVTPLIKQSPTKEPARHEYCYPGHRVNHGRHWRCVYSYHRR